MITDFPYCNCTLITLHSVCANMHNYIPVCPNSTPILEENRAVKWRSEEFFFSFLCGIEAEQRLWFLAGSDLSRSVVVPTLKAQVSTLQHRNPSSCQTRETEPKDYGFYSKPVLHNMQYTIKCMFVAFIIYSSVMILVLHLKRIQMSINWNEKSEAGLTNLIYFIFLSRTDLTNNDVGDAGFTFFIDLLKRICWCENWAPPASLLL